MAVFDWDEHNIGHIARHGVTTAEVEAVFNRPRVYEPTEIEDYFFAYGSSAPERYLVVVFTIRNERIRTATTYPMNRSKRKLYVPQLKKSE